MLYAVSEFAKDNLIAYTIAEAEGKSLIVEDADKRF